MVTSSELSQIIKSKKGSLTQLLQDFEKIKNLPTNRSYQETRRIIVEIKEIIHSLPKPLNEVYAREYTKITGEKFDPYRDPVRNNGGNQ